MIQESPYNLAGFFAMARTKYTITSEDEFHAAFYLTDRMRNYGLKFSDSALRASAEDDYRSAVNEKSKLKRVAALNAWCEKYLSAADWRKLKAAVRKRRERWRRSEDVKTIAISGKAHKLLTQIVKRDNVTFSEVLEHYLSKAVDSARGKVVGRKKG